MSIISLGNAGVIVVAELGFRTGSISCASAVASSELFLDRPSPDSSNLPPKPNPCQFGLLLKGHDWSCVNPSSSTLVGGGSGGGGAGARSLLGIDIGEAAWRREGYEVG